jgi:hypothetical protein
MRRGLRTRWAAIGAAIKIGGGAPIRISGGAAPHFASAAPGGLVVNSFVLVTPVRILDTRLAADNVGTSVQRR